MLYTILRPITRIVIQGYYRKIFVNGQHRIPQGQPVILAVNHPSAFTEPCVLATHLDRILHFLIRGDIINPRVKWFFDQTNQLPIYRFRDGFSSMRQNEKQFSYCFDILAKDGCIAIFAEGSTQHIKQTRPIQKGAARIAFGAMQNRQLDEIWIVPVGVNFESSPRPRSIVAVEVGEPISTRAHWGAYESDERAGLSELTEEIFKGLQARMIDIRHEERLAVADEILLMASHDIPVSPIPVAEYEKSRFYSTLRTVADRINHFDTAQWTEVSRMVDQYRSELGSLALADPTPALSTAQIVGWILLTPLAIPGWLFLFPAWWLSFAIQNRLNRKAEYISGFRMAGFLIFVPLLLLLWMVIAGIWAGWWVLLFPVLLPLLAMVGIWWLDHMKMWSNQRKWNSLPGEKRNDLLSLRNRIMVFVH